MTRIREFFVNLKKSTKITMISCGCFIALTFFILCFFIMFPITPSDRVLKALGRESVSKQNTVTGTVTTSPDESSNENTTSAIVTTRNHDHTDFEIIVTTGVGFTVSGNKIPVDPNHVVDPNDPPIPPVDVPDPTDPPEPTDATYPIETTEPVIPTDSTPSTESPIVTDTPPDIPSTEEQPQPTNGDNGEQTW